MKLSSLLVTSCLLAFSVSGLSISVQAQVQWKRLSPATVPSQLFMPGMAYDSHRQRVVMFGGYQIFGDKGTNETWEFDGKNWQKMSPANRPSARGAMVLVYDPARRRVLMYGGAYLPRVGVINFFTDTWEWDGKNWTRLRPANNAGHRFGSSATYDTARQRVVVFGGTRAMFQTDNETWEWDRKTWRKVNPTTSPSPRSLAGMAYDQGRQRVVLFGGEAVSGSNFSYLSDTWEFDGKTWAQMRPTTVPARRSAPAFAYDVHRRRVVMFGGVDFTGSAIYHRGTWDWDGSNWLKRSPTSAPSARHGSGVVYDVNDRRTLLFGGENASSKVVRDMWSLAPAYPAGSTAFGKGCAGSAGTPELTSSLPWLGDTLQVDLKKLPAGKTSTAFVAIGISNTRFQSQKLPLDMGFAGMPGCPLLTSSDVYLSLANNNGAAKFSAPVPHTSALRGVTVYLQGAVLDPKANAGGMTLSGGLALQLGAR